MTGDDTDDARERAIERLKAKRGFSAHAMVYVLVNLLLIVIWYVSGRGYFWPIWPLAGWGIGVGMHAWAVYLSKPITEDEIRREMDRGR